MMPIPQDVIDWANSQKIPGKLTIHQYTYPNGSPWWWRLRWKAANQSKVILPLRRNEDGSIEAKQPNFEKHRTPLYRLETLAKQAGEVVFLVEGEVCADFLESQGVVATTFGSSSGVNQADFQMLSKRRIVLWSDNDAPGQKAMAEARKKLLELGATVLCIDVDQLGFLEKDDCVDWGRQRAAQGLPVNQDALFTLPVCAGEGANLNRLLKKECAAI